VAGASSIVFSEDIWLTTSWFGRMVRTPDTPVTSSTHHGS